MCVVSTSEVSVSSTPGTLCRGATQLLTAERLVVKDVQSVGIRSVEGADDAYRELSAIDVSFVIPVRNDAAVTVTDAQMATVRLKRHRFHGEWNYTIHPTIRRRH